MDIVTYALLNGKIKNYASNVDEWLEENVDPTTGYVLDRSLQMENAAAPADMVGDISDTVSDVKNTFDANENKTAITLTRNGWNILNDAPYDAVTRAYSDKIKVTEGDVVEIKSISAASVGYIIVLYGIDGVMLHPAYNFVDITAGGADNYVTIENNGYIRIIMRYGNNEGIDSDRKALLESLVSVYVNIRSESLLDKITPDLVERTYTYTARGYSADSGNYYDSTTRLTCDEFVRVSKGDIISFLPCDNALKYSWELIKFDSSGELIQTESWTNMDASTDTVRYIVEKDGYVLPYMKWYNDSSVTISTSYLTSRCKIFTSDKISADAPKEIVVSPTSVFKTIKSAVEYSQNIMDCKVYVSPGTYNLITEFGDAYFAAISGDSATLGLVLKNRVHLIFASNSKVLCNYTGDNANVKKYFQPFRPAKYGCTIENMNIECSNVRYAVHDERVQDADQYINKYLNCKMYIDNSGNSVWQNRLVIGGGLGKSGEVIIKNCHFKAATVSGAGAALVSYHNTGASSGRSRIICDSNYFEDDGTFRISYYGTSPASDPTEALVSGNSFGSAPIKQAETAGSTVDNVSLIAWNNEIRT